MKRKFSKILGVALTVALLVSLILAAAPVSGKTLEWGKEIAVKEGTFASPYMVMTNSAVLHMVAAPTDGKLWAVVSDVGVGSYLYRSTTAGATWAKRSPPGIALTAVAVAPDDSSVVVAIQADKAYLSTENGESGTWSIIGDTVGTGNLNAIFTTGTIKCVDVSAKDGDGYRWMVVGGVDGAGAGQVAVGQMAALGGWTDYTGELGWVVSTDVVAVAFSPRFRYDDTLLAVSTTATDTFLQMADVDPAASVNPWNSESGYTTTGADITGTTLVQVATGATISLPDTYYGVDDTERVAYISLDTGATGGIYRMDDATSNGLLTGYQYSSVAYNSDNNELIIGLSTSGKVQLSTNPDATSPSFTSPPSLKRASGSVGVSSVVWSGSTMLASTTGDESGVSKGSEDGKTWNGLSFLDSDLAVITDVSISEDASVIYLAARDGNYCNIYRKQDGSWERILSELMSAANAVLVRQSPDNPAVVIVAWAGTKNLRYSSDSGETWRRSESDILVKDMAVKSDQIVFTVDASGYVSTSLDGGAYFDDYIKSLVGADNMIVEPVTGDLIVIGGSAGYVRASVSDDDGASFTRTPEGLGIADDATATFVAADKDYADSGIIYAAQTDNISRWEVGGDLEDWYSITPVSTAGTTFVITGETISALGFAGGSLYAMYQYPATAATARGDIVTLDAAVTTYNGALTAANLTAANTALATAIASKAATSSGFVRCPDPTGRGPAWKDENEAGLVFELAPSAIKFSGGSVGIWAVNGLGVVWPPLPATLPTTPAAVALTNEWDELWSYTDIVMATEAPTVAEPAEGYTATVDAALEKINPVRFSWEEIHRLASYDLRLGTNAAVSANYLTFDSATNEWISVSDGTGGVTDKEYPFVTGETYYWKVRVREPVTGPWSEIRSFTIEVPKAAVAPAPVVTVQPAEAPQITVQAPAPTPAPQVTVEVPPAAIPPTPSYIWAIIAIGAILVIAVIVLIVRTRRPV